MKPLRIDGRRIPCKVCKRHYAVIMLGKVATCSCCNRALFAGYMIGKYRGLEN